MVWVVLLSSNVIVCLLDHICIVHSFIHSVILLKFWWPESPLTVGPSPYHQLDRISPRTTLKHQTSHFKLCCPQENQSAFMLVNWRVWLNSHLGSHSTKKLHKGCKPCPLYWMGKLRRQVGQTTSACSCLPQKIELFFQWGLSIVDHLLTKKIAQFSWASPPLPNSLLSSETTQTWSAD